MELITRAGDVRCIFRSFYNNCPAGYFKFNISSLANNRQHLFQTLIPFHDTRERMVPEFFRLVNKLHVIPAG